jgi:hypothetical protein
MDSQYIPLRGNEGARDLFFCNSPTTHETHALELEVPQYFVVERYLNQFPNSNYVLSLSIYHVQDIKGHYWAGRKI